MGLGDLKKTTAKRVLGLDCSTNSMAFCLFEYDKPVKWGKINFGGANVWERLSDAQKKVAAVADQLQSDIIVIEAATYIQNKKTVILLAYSFGAIISALIKKDAKVYDLPPITWQNYIKNKPLTKDEKAAVQKQTPGKSPSWYQNQYRQIRKQRTMDWVKATYGITITDDDIGDAFGVAFVGREKFVV